MLDEGLPELAHIPGGEFTMGTDEGEEHQRPAHRVCVDEFYIGVHQVTNAEYAQFVAHTRHRAPALRDFPLIVTHDARGLFRELAEPYVWRDGLPPAGHADHPVTLIQLEDAVAYCRWLAGQTGKPFRLPTEAEWERAARGGVEGRAYPWGDAIDPSPANYLPDPDRKSLHGTTPVGRYPANGYALYDTSGNVWEWVADWYQPDYYRSADRLNPRGPDEGSSRLVRGGSWVCHDVRFLRCAHRHPVPPDTYAYSIGFRVACSPPDAD